MSGHYGDYLSGETIAMLYHSYNSLGASTTPTSAGSVVVYKDDSATETSVGIATHTIGYDARAGVNLVVINSAASQTFYSVGGMFHAIASGTSLDGQFVNVPVGSFTIQKTYQAGMIHRGKFAAGGTSAFSLDATAGLRSSTSSFHDGNVVYASGVTTGSQQARIVASYAGATGTVTPDRALTTGVVSTGSYELYAGSLPSQDSELADSLLSRNVAGGSSGTRMVKEALYVLRHKVDASTPSNATVYKADDSSSAFTFSASTAGFPFSKIAPAS